MVQSRVLADLRLAVRHLRRASGYAATAILTFALAIAASRALRSLLYGVAPDDAVTYGVVLAAVLAVVGLAAWLPARRALAGEPQAILRQA